MFDHLIDVLGQLPFLKSYSHLTLGFAAPDDADLHVWHLATIEAITKASLDLTRGFPWLGGKVVEDEDIFRVLPDDGPSSRGSIVRVKDCQAIAPSYKSIVDAKAPSSLLDGKILTMQVAFPESYQDSAEKPAPVIEFQVNLVDGGILLNCAAQHNIVDMMGIEQCFNHLATVICGGEIPCSAIEQGNRDRAAVVPLLRAGESSFDHSQFRRQAPPADSKVTSPHTPKSGSNYSWRYYRFTSQASGAIKKEAENQLAELSESDTVAYISTNDALSAFCWQAISGVRLCQHGNAQASTRFCRAVNARPAMGVPREYMGDLVVMCVARFTLGEIVTATLGTVAAALRRQLIANNNEQYIRSFATFIAREKDRSVVSYGGDFNVSTDIGSSSWTDVQLSGVKFGFLGKPDFVRRPNFIPLKSDIYFMPKTDAGDVDALLCLTDEDFAGLDADARWASLTEYIG